ncbi:CAP domain-containing protein [Candidatus Saccharibacteria bacterium]|nr:CAP domain-containing protein [Candidatus Saccharibacteria bacterium]
MSAKIKTTPRHRGHDHPFKPRKVNRRTFNQVYWPYLPVILVIGCLLALGLGQSSFQTALKHPTRQVLAYASSMQDQALLRDTNAQRSLANVPTLSESTELDRAAQAKAQDMALRNYWSHNTPDGNPPWIFVTGQNYNYQKLGENLAAGFDNEQSAINGWMASEHHKDNLLDPSFSQVGFGVAHSANYTAAGGGPMTIVVAFYGSPASAQPTIASVQGDSSSKSVSLAQLSVAKLPVVGLATNIAIGAALLALLIWAARHVRALRRALARGERFAYTHPLLDVGLLVISALSYLLTRTAGLVH